ncbi:MAG: hypothetical protein K6F96_02360 [Bacteroidales bacterium]|nr:hypothetical protein [Bacteroidales bacterium]
MLINFCLINDIAKTVETTFYTQKQPNQHPIQVRPSDTAILLSSDNKPIKNQEPLYFSLIHPEEECCGKSFKGTLRFDGDPFITKRVINQWLYIFFRTHAEAVRLDFSGRLEVWIKDPNQPPYGNRATQYLRFSLSPYSDFMEHPWALMVAFNGVSCVYNKPVTQLNLQTDSYRLLVDSEVVHSAHLANRHKRLLSSALPVINRELESELHIKRAQRFIDNKYSNTKAHIEYFCNEYLFNYSIPELQIDTTRFFSPVPSSNLMQVVEGSEALVFGGNAEDTDPMNGIKEHGVFRSSPHPHINLFFIYLKEHQNIANRLYNVLMYENYSDELKKEYDDLNTKNTLSHLIGEQFTTKKGLSIAFSSLSIASKEIEAGLNKQHRNPHEPYAAVFLCPIKKDGINNPYHELYYQVKEMLLQRGIVCQALYYKRPHSEKFHLHIPIIAVALSAKVGGIPWKLKTPNPDGDLVVGVGAFRSSLSNERFIGSAFCFNGEGVFQEFDCYRHNDNEKLVADILKAIMRFMKNNELRHPERLIIHYFKTMGKRESAQIMEMLTSLNVNIPVYIITINKTETCDFFAFDDASLCLMPHSGTIVKLNPGDFLLYNNDFYASNSTSKNILFPLRVRTEKVVRGQGKIKLTDAEAGDLLSKVYQFSRLYWKSVRLQNLPVTIAYPEMVAEIVPHFTNAHLPDFGKESLWPL